MWGTVLSPLSSLSSFGSTVAAQNPEGHTNETEHASGANHWSQSSVTPGWEGAPQRQRQEPTAHCNDRAKWLMAFREAWGVENPPIHLSAGCPILSSDLIPLWPPLNRRHLIHCPRSHFKDHEQGATVAARSPEQQRREPLEPLTICYAPLGFFGVTLKPL